MEKEKLKTIDGLESKLLKFKPLKDSRGYYVPFCDFGYKNSYSKQLPTCNSPECEHYNKLYIKLNE